MSSDPKNPIPLILGTGFVAMIGLYTVFKLAGPYLGYPFNGASRIEQGNSSVGPYPLSGYTALAGASRIERGAFSVDVPAAAPRTAFVVHEPLSIEVPAGSVLHVRNLGTTSTMQPIPVFYVFSGEPLAKPTEFMVYGQPGMEVYGPTTFRLKPVDSAGQTASICLTYEIVAASIDAPDRPDAGSLSAMDSIRAAEREPEL